MKFDKIMEFCYRVLCVFTATIVFAGCVCSCFRRPIVTSAAGEPDPASIIQMAWNYGNNYIHNMEVVESAFKHDLDNGTIDATSDLARQIAGAVLYQKLMSMDTDLIIQEAAESLVYQQFSDNWSTIPDSYTVSSHDSFAGYCKDKNGGYHYVMLLAQGDIIYESDLFIICVNDLKNPANRVSVSEISYNEYNGRANIYFNPSSLKSPHFYDRLGYFSSDVTLSSSILWLQATRNDKIIPTIEPSWINRYIVSYSNSYPGYNMMGNVGNVGLSSETVNKNTPWTYYNNTMLPYIQQHFPDVYNSYPQYLVFPDGYTPKQDPDYINPSAPGGGVVLPPAQVVGTPENITVNDRNVSVFAPVIGQIGIDGINMFFVGAAGAAGVAGGIGGVMINGELFDLPLDLPDFDGHSISIDDLGNIIFDGIEYHFTDNNQLSIDDILHNLPIGTPTQAPTDNQLYEYQYEIPTVERIDVVEATLSAPDLSSFGDSINFIFAIAHDLFEDVGALPLVLGCFALGAVGYALWKIGG